jgi:DNA uptake protein ComE-like DNA-binding protein
VQAIQQGHRQGYSDFRNWYRKWEKAKENSDAEMAKKICGFILEAGLDIIFPEEEVFIVILKKAAAKAYELAADQLSKAGIPKGNIEEFLDAVWAAEEHGITTQLDVHDKFFDSNAPEVEEAIDSFIRARMGGWDSTEKLPAETLAILKKAGVGEHGAAAANVIAERVLSAHIQSVLRADRNVTFAASSAADIEVMAEIAALRQMQSLPNVDNRNRIWTLERKLPDMFRTMCDINNDSALMIHIRLGLDKDKGEDIVASRHKDGPFKSSNELLNRKILNADELKEVEGHIVCY